MAEGGHDGAWYCGNRPQFDEQGQCNFCPEEGCPKGYCALDAGWKNGDPSPDRCTGVARPSASTAERSAVSGERERIAQIIYDNCGGALMLLREQSLKAADAILAAAPAPQAVDVGGASEKHRNDMADKIMQQSIEIGALKSRLCNASNLPEEPSDAVIRAVDKAAHEHWPNARKMAVGMYKAIREAPVSTADAAPEGEGRKVDQITKGLTDLEKHLLLKTATGWGSWMWSCGNGLVAKGLGSKRGGSIHFDTELAKKVIASLRRATAGGE